MAHGLLADIGVAVVGGQVLAAHRQPDGSERPVEALRGHPQDRRERLAGSQHPCGDRSAGVVDELRLLAAGGDIDGDGLNARKQLVHWELQVDLVLDRLFPGDERHAVHGQGLDGREPLAVCGPIGNLDDLGLDVQEPHPQLENRPIVGLDEALGLLLPGLGAPGGAPGLGSQDAELPANAVLGGGGAVGVEDVALEEDGVGHLPGVVEVHGLTSPISPLAEFSVAERASPISAVSVSSQLVSPRSDLNRCRASRVSLPIRIQA